MSLKLVITSDTHGLHSLLGGRLPPGDVFIHCGDETAHGHEREALEFNKWMGTLPYKYKIAIPGNHSWWAERFLPDNSFGSVFSRQRQQELTSNYTLLMDSSVTINGIKFWGSPFTLEYFDWAFMLPEDKLRDKWANIPDDTNVVITHGPPYGIGDLSVRGQNCGSTSLANRLSWLEDLQLHCCGHIHESYGSRYSYEQKDEIYGPAYINASFLDENYQPKNDPVIFEIYGDED